MLPSFILKYQTDERAGVQKLAAQARKRLKDLEQERKRIEALKVYEKQYQDKKYHSDNALYIVSIFFVLKWKNHNVKPLWLMEPDSRDPSVGKVLGKDFVGRAWLRIFPFDKIGFIKHQ